MAAIIERAHQALDGVLHPTVVNVDHWLNCLIVTACVFAIIFVLHKTIAVRFKCTYFALHVMVNTIVTAIVWKGAVRSLLNPTQSTVPLTADSPNSHMYLCWVFALHVYHPIFFRTNSMDWIHHIPVYVRTCCCAECGALNSDRCVATATTTQENLTDVFVFLSTTPANRYTVNLLIFGCLFGDVFCLQTIVLTGVPGGIDYLLLVLEGEGVMSRATYKHWSAYINNWCRAPMGVLSGYICLLGV